MRRREFISLAGAAGLAVPLTARAQRDGRLRRVAILMGIAEDAEGQRRIAALKRALQGRGWVEGRDIRYEVSWAEGKVELADKLAREIVAAKPDVVIGHATVGSVAMRKATTTIPIIIVQVADPIHEGLVQGLPRPGGNISGFASFEPSMVGKWIELLKGVNPTLDRIGYISNPRTVASLLTDAAVAAAPRLGVSAVALDMAGAEQIGPVLAKFAERPKSGLVVLPDVFTSGNADAIIAAAARNRLPAIYPFKFFAARGGLLTYGIDVVDLFVRTSDYVDRVLRGEKIGELPVQQPTKFELVVNLKTARAMAFEVPGKILALADEVIE